VKLSEECSSSIARSCLKTSVSMIGELGGTSGVVLARDFVVEVEISTAGLGAEAAVGLP